MRSYEAARTYFSILGFLSWCVIGGGGIIAIVALGTVGQMSRSFGGSPFAGLVGAAPGLGIMFLGFLGLVFVQIGRAGVDTAEYTQQGLKIAREQLQVSQQALKQGSVVVKGYAALEAAKVELRADGDIAKGAPAASFSDQRQPTEQSPPLAHKPGELIKYQGKTIRVVEAGYSFGGTTYPSLSGAQARIDESSKWVTPTRTASMLYGHANGQTTSSDKTVPPASSPQVEPTSQTVPEEDVPYKPFKLKLPSER